MADTFKLIVDGVEVDAPEALRCCRRASWPAPRSRASATTSACRSPATAACAWSSGSARRSRSPRAPRPWATCRRTRTARRTEIITKIATRREGARRRDGVPADQPPARLPDLRPGRRVRPAGPGDGLWPRRHALRREQARGRREVHGAAGQDGHDPLHPVHALRPLRDRSGRRARDRSRQPRRGRGDHDLSREGADVASCRAT